MGMCQGDKNNDLQLHLLTFSFFPLTNFLINGMKSFLLYLFHRNINILKLALSQIKLNRVKCGSNFQGLLK